MAAKYPFLECDKHPGIHMSVFVCGHIRQGAMVASYEPPTIKHPGRALCEDCDLLTCRAMGREEVASLMKKMRAEGAALLCEKHYEELQGKFKQYLPSSRIQ